MSKVSKNQSGVAALLITIVIMGVGTIIAVSATFVFLNRIEASRNIGFSERAYYAAEAGLEDALIRFFDANKQVPSLYSFSINGTAVDVSISTDEFNITTISADGNTSSRRRSAAVRIGLDPSATSLSFAAHIGTRGLTMDSNSTVNGNVFSNGSIVGTGNVVGGEAISAGPTGLIHGIHATSSAYAHTIENSTIDKNAYYQTISDSTVSGTSYPGSSDQPTSSLPITDALIEQWENDALAGGTISSPCPYKITTNTTIGPKKINCDLEISTNPTVTLTGPIWVAGNISLKNNPTLQIASSLENSISSGECHRSTLSFHSVPSHSRK